MQSEAVIGVLNNEVTIKHEAVPGFLDSDETFDFRVRMEIVRGATSERVAAADPELTPHFIEAARNLEVRGVKAIVGNCAWMAPYQRDIAKSVSIPVITSSFILVPLVYQMLSENQRVGILAFDSRLISEKLFNAVGWSSEDIPVAIKGVQETESWQAGQEHPKYDLKRGMDLVKVAKDLIQGSPDVGAIVLGCTTFPHYAHMVQKATGLPVFDITTAIKMVFAAIEPKNWLE